MSTKNSLRKIFKIHIILIYFYYNSAIIFNEQFEIYFAQGFFYKIGRPKPQENKKLSLLFPRTLCPKSRAHDSGKEASRQRDSTFLK